MGLPSRFAGQHWCPGAGFLPYSATTCPEIKDNTLRGARRAGRISGKSLAWTPPLPFVSSMISARSLDPTLRLLICTVRITASVSPSVQWGCQPQFPHLYSGDDSLSFPICTVGVGVNLSFLICTVEIRVSLRVPICTVGIRVSLHFPICTVGIRVSLHLIICTVGKPQFPHLYSG